MDCLISNHDAAVLFYLMWMCWDRRVNKSDIDQTFIKLKKLLALLLIEEIFFVLRIKLIRLSRNNFLTIISIRWAWKIHLIFFCYRFNLLLFVVLFCLLFLLLIFYLILRKRNYLDTFFIRVYQHCKNSRLTFQARQIPLNPFTCQLIFESIKPVGAISLYNLDLEI